MADFYKEYYCMTVDNTAIAADTGNTFVDVSTLVSVDSPFELVKRSHVATDNRIYLNFRDDTTGKFTANTKQELNTISADHSSTGSIIFFKPYTLIDSVVLQKGTTYTVQMSDYSGASNSLRLALHGGLYTPGIAPWQSKKWSKTEVFDYAITGFNLNPNQSTTQQITTSTDADFLLYRITGTFNRAFYISLSDGYRSYDWMNAPVHSNNIVGSGLFPHNLPYPKWIPRGTTISIYFQDLSGLSNTISLCFSGKKFYD